MPDQPLPQHDPRSVDELVNAALTEADEDVAWDAVCALHWRGTREVLERAHQLCSSECSQERRLGADMLGQLGVPGRTFPKESAAILFNMLDAEKDADVLQAIFVAFSFHHLPDIVRVAPKYADHPDPDVRHAVVLSVTGCTDQIAIDLLIKCSNDVDPDVRDWATFGLGTQLELDTPGIRAALVARLDDPDEFARGEAMVGLARRQDQRAVPAILKDLTPDATVQAIEAAALTKSPQLLEALKTLRGSPDICTSLLDEAISACTPRPPA